MVKLVMTWHSPGHCAWRSVCEVDRESLSARCRSPEASTWAGGVSPISRECLPRSWQRSLGCVSFSRTLFAPPCYCAPAARDARSRRLPLSETETRSKPWLDSVTEICPFRKDESGEGSVDPIESSSSDWKRRRSRATLKRFPVAQADNDVDTPVGKGGLAHRSNRRFRCFVPFVCRHYNSNRAPLGLFFHVNWFTDKTKVKALGKFLDYVIENHNDAYFVTMQQALLWMRTPKKVGTAVGASRSRMLARATMDLSAISTGL